MVLLSLNPGPDYTRARLILDGGNPEAIVIDEIEDFWRARYLTATEATWRIFAFNITSKTPAVTSLPIHLSNTIRHTQYHRNDGSQSSMTLLKRYFYRPRGTFLFDGDTVNFDNLKYAEYYQIFRIIPWKETSFAQVNGINKFMESGIPVNEKRVLVILRTKQHFHITRLAAAKPSEGERFYIRALLQFRSARSYEDLRRHNDVLFDTFQQAAITLGLFAGEKEAEFAMMEAVTALYTPNQLRRLFVDILINECSDAPLTLWNLFQDRLSLDHLIRTGSEEAALNITLEDIGRQLEEYGKNLQGFGLPMPIPTITEITHELERWAPASATMIQSVTDAYRRFNQEQRTIFNTILTAVNEQTPLRLFIDGKAGRGKTYLLNAVCDRVRSMGKIVIPTATSAFAAQLYAGGRTAHSAFKACHLYLLSVTKQITDQHFPLRFPLPTVMRCSYLTFATTPPELIYSVLRPSSLSTKHLLEIKPSSLA